MVTKVEEVAREICLRERIDPDSSVAHGGDWPRSAWTDYIVHARAAIWAMREPTGAMVAAGGNSQTVTARANRRGSFRAMIDAALNEKES